MAEMVTIVSIWKNGSEKITSVAKRSDAKRRNSMGRTKAHQKYIHPETGKPVPGATTVINELGWNKNALIAWARREALKGNDPDKLRDKAASIGTLAHALIEEHLGETCDAIEPRPVNRDEFPPEDLDKAENAMIAYLDWEDLHHVVPMESEIRLVHPHYYYGGTIDMVAVVDGKLTLVDFKTSKGVYPDHVIQAASYTELMLNGMVFWKNDEEWVHEEYMNDPEQVIILHINKENGRMTEHRFSLDDLDYPWEVFWHCLQLRKLKNRMPI